KYPGVHALAIYLKSTQHNCIPVFRGNRMKAQQEYQWLYRYRRSLFWLAPVLLVTSALGIYLLVYMTGGIKFVYSHSMYVPILLAGFLYGMTGGGLFGLFAGLVLGPFMPIDVI